MIRRIGLLGCGTIGSDLARAIDSGKIANSSLESIFDISDINTNRLVSMLTHKPSKFVDFTSFINSNFDIMVEAASQAAVQHYAVHALSSGKDLMIMSVGALSDNGLMTKLIQLSSASSHRIYLPSGAIAGIDGIRAVREFIQNISLTTTKSPRALAGAPFFQKNPMELDKITKPTTIFEGSAAEAVKEFPANVNVAAVLSLAGIGFEKTCVRIVADPNARNNIHSITAEGSFGEMRIEVSNVPSPNNAKTSYLAVLSAIECLKSICSPGVSIGS